MNFRSLISAIFPEQPSLEEFVNAHNPVTLHDVEFLEKKYSEIYSVPQIHNKDWIEP